MAVENIGEKYRCNICGNEVTVTKAGGGTLVCCREDMEKISQLVVTVIHDMEMRRQLNAV